MSDIYLYTIRLCPYCIRAKRLLTNKGISFCEIPVDNNPEQRMEMMTLSGRRTVPQIWVGETHIGGCDELYALQHSGRLDEML